MNTICGYDGRECNGCDGINEWHDCQWRAISNSEYLKVFGKDSK